MTKDMIAMNGMDEFDVLLDDVLRAVANPDLPERVRVHVRTRVWVQEGAARERRVVVPPAVFLDVQERLRPKRDARSTMFALLAHVAAIALVLWVGAAKLHVALTHPADLTMLTPPPMPPAKDAMGGGGGQKGATPVTKGALPKFAETQITPPMIPLTQPKIRMPEATIEVQKDLKMADNAMPVLGMPNATLMGSSMGNGRGTGLGDGDGVGLGSGTGGNYGGSLRSVGGGVSMPVVIYQVDPEFSEEARKAKFMGTVLVGLVVDAEGRPQAVHAVRDVGMGLGDKAVAAVKQYKFKPAYENGKPVPVRLTVEVNFQIF